VGGEAESNRSRCTSPPRGLSRARAASLRLDVAARPARRPGASSRLISSLPLLLGPGSLAATVQGDGSGFVSAGSPIVGEGEREEGGGLPWSMDGRDELRSGGWAAAPGSCRSRAAPRAAPPPPLPSSSLGHRQSPRRARALLRRVPPAVRAGRGREKKHEAGRNEALLLDGLPVSPPNRPWMRRIMRPAALHSVLPIFPIRRGEHEEGFHPH
jgi:hypothetical protein